MGRRSVGGVGDGLNGDGGGSGGRGTGTLAEIAEEFELKERSRRGGAEGGDENGSESGS